VATNPIDRNKEMGATDPPKEQDSRIGLSVSPEHRAILEAALTLRPKRPLFEVLASMPNVGEDADFAHSRE
jgi:antitoxin FitA